MANQSPITIPNKTFLMFSLIIIIVISSGMAEIVEVFSEPIFPKRNAVTFEILEHVTLLSLLLIFMTKFLINPMRQQIILRAESEAKLKQGELKYLNIIDALPDAVVHVSTDGMVIDYKSKKKNIVNFEIGKNVCDSLPPDTVLDFLKHMNATLEDGNPQRVDLKLQMESEVFCQVFNFVKSSENEVLIFIRDITNRKIYEEKLEHLSTHDVLTGLYNRTFYEAELERLATSRRYPVGIIIIDLDGLKVTNDNYGHAAGDKMICKAADILKESFRAEDLVARTGGDEFTILLPETDAGSLQFAQERITRCLDEANKTDEGCKVKFSMGTEIAESKEKILEAVKIADKKMYQNKEQRKASI